MPNFNQVVLLGRLTADPETKQLSDTSVGKFTLAVSEKYKETEFTSFVDCELFGDSVETLTKYVKKGSHLLVTGRLRQENWEAQDGSKRSKLIVKVDKFQFIDPPSNNTNTPNKVPEKTPAKKKYNNDDSPF